MVRESASAATWCLCQQAGSRERQEAAREQHIFCFILFPVAMLPPQVTFFASFEDECLYPPPLFCYTFAVGYFFVDITTTLGKRPVRSVGNLLGNLGQLRALTAHNTNPQRGGLCDQATTTSMCHCLIPASTS